MEVVVSSPSGDFDFNGARISPYLSAPSSPKRFGEYFMSAPTSPSRLSEFMAEFDYFGDSVSDPKHEDEDEDGDDGFAFHVSKESEKLSLSAEDLFDGGKIKAVTVKPPSRLGLEQSKSPIVSRSKETQERRGRDRTPASQSSSNTGRRATRSLSPYRNSDYTWEEEQGVAQQQQSSKESSSSSSNSNSKASLISSSANSKSSRRWRLKDLLLFRSASEGRGSSKDPLRKYSVLYKKPEEAKLSSFRSVDSPTSVPAGSNSKRRGPVSAHELHYAMKKAESQDMKKKTFLPYRQGILGRLAGFGF